MQSNSNTKEEEIECNNEYNLCKLCIGSTCIKCDDFFSLDDKNNCVSCMMINCLSCDHEKNICLSCSEEYKLSPDFQKCVLISNIETQKNWSNLTLALVASLTTFFMFLALCWFFAKVEKKKKKKRKRRKKTKEKPILRGSRGSPGRFRNSYFRRQRIVEDNSRERIPKKKQNISRRREDELRSEITFGRDAGKRMFRDEESVFSFKPVKNHIIKEKFEYKRKKRERVRKKVNLFNFDPMQGDGEEEKKPEDRFLTISINDENFSLSLINLTTPTEYRIDPENDCLYSLKNNFCKKPRKEKRIKKSTRVPKLEKKQKKHRKIPSGLPGQVKNSVNKNFNI